ncbi:MAG TPA: hypothetical protein PKM51_00775 [Chitinophagales bacterium]|nr:hypothetical protein [Chitinophagales bacterium]
MKWIGLLAISLTAACTHPCKEVNTNQRIKAKIVRITCASKVIQVLDSNYYYLGETWTRKGEPDTTYLHVAKVLNTCDMPDTLKEENEFYFRIIPENEANNNCVVCEMYDFPPNKGIYIKVVK